jgi:hypothetical protein
MKTDIEYAALAMGFDDAELNAHITTLRNLLERAKR